VAIPADQVHLGKGRILQDVVLVGGTAGQIANVLVEFVDFVKDHATANPAQDGGLAVVGKIDAGRRAEDLKNRGEIRTTPSEGSTCSEGCWRDT
jgi:hypothetical protein